MKRELYYYEISPMIFPAGQAVDFSIKPMSAHAAFEGDYTVVVQRLDSGSTYQPFSAWNHTDIECKPDENGCLNFSYTASSEGELYVRILKEGKRLFQLAVYALDDDLAGRIPLRGDLHMHTCRSDGKESPAVVCANYRKRGYDFIVITDHHRYYPSLEAIDAYKDVNIALNILPGEEVHLPENAVHIVNAGGLFSVNGLIKTKENYTETDGALDKRRYNDTVTPPDCMELDEYTAELDRIEAELKADGDFPENVNSRWYASCVWAFEKIRQADGLGVFAHPYWISDMWQIPEPFTRYMLKHHPFDAFEVLGGENYYEHNGFQTALYYDEYKYGRVHPIVGSTDSHGSTGHNRNAAICSTIVFAEKNERASIIGAIKDGYSVAVDTISKEYRLVGEHRFQKYAAFLMENYFPLHDRQAEVDGELMYQYINGNASAYELDKMAARAEKLMNKLIKTK
nr:hypothetical protein [Clostridia bacterium]